MNNLLSFASVMGTVGSIIIAILILLVTITVHEFGHYLIGKLFKFKINEFAIGMGPAIYKKVKKNGEIFSIRIFPLGGFCAFEGEDEDDTTVAEENAKNAEKQKAETAGAQVANDGEVFDELKNDDGKKAIDEQSKALNANVESNVAPQKKLSENAFNNKKPYQRILVLIAGASVNFIVAILVIVLNMAIYGHFAIEAYEVRTDEVYADSSLQNGDVIRAIDGHFLYLTTDISDALANKKQGDEVTLDIVRDGQKQKLTVKLRSDVGPSVMGEFNESFKALGMATVIAVNTTEGSPLPSGQYLYKMNDGATYEECTRIYDLEQLAQLFSDKKEGETVGIWLSTDDETAENGRQLVQIKLGEGWSEAVANYNKALAEGETKAYRAIIKDYLKVESYGMGYQVQSTHVKLSFGELFFRPLAYSFKVVGSTFKAIGQIFSGSLSVTSLSGPVSTISMTTEYVKSGFSYGFGLNFILEIGAFIGISVAIFNLLPIPALDGARTVFVAIEWVRGKPVNRKIEAIIHTVGLFALLIFAIGVDVLKLFIH